MNSACASPIRDHIVLGGGEDAMQVDVSHETLPFLFERSKLLTY